MVRNTCFQSNIVSVTYGLSSTEDMVMEARSCFEKGTVKMAPTKDLLIIRNSNERPTPRPGSVSCCDGVSSEVTR